MGVNFFFERFAVSRTHVKNWAEREKVKSFVKKKGIFGILLQKN